MTLYVDNEYKCHIEDDGTRRAVETEFFDGKCRAFVEGYKYDDSGSTVTVYPWRNCSEILEFQEQYEEMLAEAEASYEQGVNSI